jgi:dTDP-4-amino-4,6-dideoxygalactose transaminase
VIPYGRQDIPPEDIDAVTGALRSDSLTQGHSGPQFEQARAGDCDARSAIEVSNATAGLADACLALPPAAVSDCQSSISSIKAN